jgi:CheY-like chemotaxis protein
MMSPTVLLRRVTILVVDDEEPLRRLMARVLEQAGYRCLTAGDGVPALRLFELSRCPIQLVITDVSMPGMRGPELAAHIAARPHRPPVLFVSGDHDGTTRAAGGLRSGLCGGVEQTARVWVRRQDPRGEAEGLSRSLPESPWPRRLRWAVRAKPTARDDHVRRGTARPDGTGYVRFLLA